MWGFQSAAGQILAETGFDQCFPQRRCRCAQQDMVEEFQCKNEFGICGRRQQPVDAEHGPWIFVIVRNGIGPFLANGSGKGGLEPDV